MSSAPRDNALDERIREYLAQENYSGIANALLGTLTRTQQESVPDSDSLSLITHTARVIESKYGLPASFHYSRSHTDTYIPYEHQGDWQKDTYINLMILTFLLGPSRDVLPSFHGLLRPYYQQMAKKQAALLADATERYMRVVQKKRQCKEEIAVQIKDMLSLGFSAEHIGEHVAAMTQQATNAIAPKASPLSPNDFK